MTFRKEKRKRNTKVSLRNLPKIAEPIEAEGPKKRKKRNVSDVSLKEKFKFRCKTYPRSQQKPKDLKKENNETLVNVS